MAEWHNELPENLREDPTLKKYETPEAAYQGLIEANARLGTSIRIPGPDADTDTRNEFIGKLQSAAPELYRLPEAENEQAMAEYRATMGIPEDTSEYINPEGFKGLPDDVLTEMQKVAKKAALSKRQYQDMITEMAALDAQGQEAAGAAVAAANAELKAEWGLAHDERVAMTDRLAQQFLPEGTDIPMDANMRKFLFAMGQSMSGAGPQAHFQPHVPTQQLSPEEAREQIAELTKRLVNEGPGPGYKGMMDRMAKLQKLAHPGASR